MRVLSASHEDGVQTEVATAKVLPGYKNDAFAVHFVWKQPFEGLVQTSRLAVFAHVFLLFQFV